MKRKKVKNIKHKYWFEDIHNKTKAYLTVLIFLIFSTVFWLISDPFSLWVSKINPWLALIVTILINPAYILLIYWLYSQYKIRGLISGILISLALDIVSLMHSINFSGILPTNSESIPLYGYADTIIYKGLIQFLPVGKITVFLLYIVIPTLIIYLSLRIIRRSTSFNRIVKEAM
jgi:hypothetical protein